MNPLETHINDLCTKNPDGVACAVVFRTGQMVNGALRVSKVTGHVAGNLYELATGGMIGDPSGREQRPAVFHYFFLASEVSQFMLAEIIEQPRVMAAGNGGLIVPRG